MNLTSIDPISQISLPDRATSFAAAVALADLMPTPLAQLHDWLLWSLASRDGKSTKIPHRGIRETWNSELGDFVWVMNGARLNDPKHRMPLELAIFKLTYAFETGWDSGLGFVLKPDGQFVGIDLDNCRDPETGELTEFAREVISHFPGARVEISQSGRGVKIIVRGGKPTNRCRTAKQPGVEIYGAGDNGPRYFAMTGRLLEGSSNEIVDGQAGIDWLCSLLFPPEPKQVKRDRSADVAPTLPSPSRSCPHSDALPDDATIVEAGHRYSPVKFGAAWRGDAGPWSGDESARDMALATMLAVLCHGDAVRIDSLFRQSGCFRAKWERDDYRERTIRRAIERAAGNCFDYTTRTQERELTHYARAHETAQVSECSRATPYPTDGVWVHHEIARAFRPRVEYAHCNRIPTRCRAIGEHSEKNCFHVDCGCLPCRACGPVRIRNFTWYFSEQASAWPEIHCYVAVDEADDAKVRRRLDNDRQKAVKAREADPNSETIVPQCYGFPLPSGQVIHLASVPIRRNGETISQSKNVDDVLPLINYAVTETPSGKRIRSSYDVAWARVFDDDESQRTRYWEKDPEAPKCSTALPPKMAANLREIGIEVAEKHSTTRDLSVVSQRFKADPQVVAKYCTPAEADRFIWWVAFEGLAEALQRLDGWRRFPGVYDASHASGSGKAKMAGCKSAVATKTRPKPAVGTVCGKCGCLNVCEEQRETIVFRRCLGCGHGWEHW